MENLELNKQEKQELEKRGFFVKKDFKIKDLYKNSAYILVYLGLTIIPGIFIGLPLWIATESYIILTILVLLFLLPIRKFFIDYIVSGRIFYFGNDNIVQLGTIGIKRKSKKIYHNLGLLERFIHKLINSGKGGFMGLWLYGCLIFFILYGKQIFDFFGKEPNLEYPLLGLIFGVMKILLLNTLTYGAYFIGFVGFLYLLKIVFQRFHTLSYFGNLGEKIQSLTPRIEEQSQEIQSEFQSDMNFSVLSNGFDSLSATFSEIVSLVIKLEKVEARANKGNLFDSEKYINSLRSDIVTPLTSLKTFLEKQKTELIQSQKEPTRVRVGGNEGTENIELQSKRSESLIQELTENIEKLDVMIGKMG